MIVDDNRNYREAFKRMLLMRDYDVCEAEDSEQALDILRQENPDVVVTDLWMRTKDEGLELIRQIKNIDPAYPIIMISAVGTFETGAQASQLGAFYVISKSRIEEELEKFFEAIEWAHKKYKETKNQLNIIQQSRDSRLSGEQIQGLKQNLEQILADPETDPYVKGEAYDALLQLSEMEMRETSARNIASILSTEGQEEAFKRVDTILRKEIPDIDNFDKESLEALRSAEIFFQEQERNRIGVDFSRSTGFSYCFAVENEAKARLRKKLVRLFSNTKTFEVINLMLDNKINNLDLFFHQYILRLQQQFPFEFTTDNVRQTLLRIKEFEQCYKPDGLKALGIVILCFGRSYEITTRKGKLDINNPLGLKGLEEEETLDFARQLVLLQHYRNPYIHPEISEMEKLSQLRQTTFTCLGYISRLV